MTAPSLACILLLCSAAAEDLRCLSPDSNGEDPTTVFTHYLQNQTAAALERRTAGLDRLKSAEEIEAYQQRLQRVMTRQLGGFPQRAPLNAQTVGRVQGDGYRIERVLFESRPAHHVTATLYLPAGAGPFPGVVIASGHSRTGKLADYNQRYGIAHALNGIAALCYDPIGQGERSQILASDGSPRFESTTREHWLVGVGSILVGSNTASYRVWDGMRAIDYLISRADIDGAKIGFAGCSGGGTVTSYVMALDNRVKCAAPSCYLTTFARLLATIGPQDAEQNIFGQLELGLDQPDYVLMRAPRPTLISASSDDFFDISGTWDNFREGKRIYTKLGFSERIDLVEAAGGHGVHPGNLVATVRWMRRWLLGIDDAVTLAPIPLHSADELNCTEFGQVLRLPGEQSVFELNVARANELAKQRQAAWSRDSEKALARVREVAGVRPLAELPQLEMEEIGRVDRENYHIDKIVLQAPGGVPIPALTFHPRIPKDGVYLYVHGGGKEADGVIGGPIERLVKEGYVVVSADLSGLGETAAGGADDVVGDWRTYYLAYLLGKSLVGIRTEDLLSCSRWAAHYETQTPRQVQLVGVGTAGVVALHAAALEPSLFASLTLRDTIEAWSPLLAEQVPQDLLTSTVHGALVDYDLPDLRRSFGAEKVNLSSVD